MSFLINIRTSDALITAARSKYIKVHKRKEENYEYENVLPLVRRERSYIA